MNVHKIILILLMAAPLSTYATCEIATGVYADFGGTETFIQLALQDHRSYELRRETWLPGNYEKREEKSRKGQYACVGHTLTLTFGDSVGKARLVKVGENPVKLTPHDKTLEFWMIHGPELKFMENEILYLDSEHAH